jgi:hypothetical protein
VTATVSIRDTIESDLGALFEFQADPEASAMAAFPSRDLHAFLENQHKIEVDPAAVEQTIVVDGDVVGSVLSWDGRRRSPRRLLDRPRLLAEGVRDGGVARVPRRRPPPAVAGARRGAQRRIASSAREVRFRVRPI